MSAIVALTLFLIQAAPSPPPGFVLDQPPCSRETETCEPWGEFVPEQPDPELGPGPHTLIISDGDSMTRMEYASGEKCRHARDAIRLQTAPPPNSNGIIYGQPKLEAFCVPR